MEEIDNDALLRGRSNCDVVVGEMCCVVLRESVFVGKEG